MLLAGKIADGSNGDVADDHYHLFLVIDNFSRLKKLKFRASLLIKNNFTFFIFLKNCNFHFL